MLHKAWNSKGGMPYRFPRSSVKFQGHTVQNITDFDPNWAFPNYRPVAAFKSLRFALFLYFDIYNYIYLDTSYHFRLYLYFLNILYFFKYSCSNIFHSPYTFCQRSCLILSKWLYCDCYKSQALRESALCQTSLHWVTYLNFTEGVKGPLSEICYRFR